MQCQAFHHFHSVFLCIIMYYSYNSDHKHGTINIYNSQNVFITNCTFYNNTSSSYFTRKPYQGSAGGLSIGYNSQLVALNNVNVLVTNCNFTNNRAAPPSGLNISPTELQARRIFSGRGGGLSIPVSLATSSLNCVVNNSVFINNYAENFGAGLFIFTGGFVANQTYMIGNNIFDNNLAANFAGALSFANFANTSSLTCTFYNCSFNKNYAQTAGCIHLTPTNLGYPGVHVKFEECVFNNNTATDYAGAITIVSYNFFGNRQRQNPVEFVNW